MNYAQQQIALQNRLIKKYQNRIYRALFSQVEPYIRLVHEKGIEAALSQANQEHPTNTEIGPVIMDLYKDAAKLSEPQLKIKGFGSFGMSLNFIRDVLQYFAEFIFEKVILPISQTTLDQIKELLTHAIEEGWGIDKTVSKLKDETIPAWRVRMIARTESIRGMNYAKWSAAHDEDYQIEKRWVAIEDKRTRLAHTHYGVDGEIRDLDLPFSNNLFYPGDPDGPPEQTINCRCALAFRYKRDANGDLVPKTVSHDLENISELVSKL